MIEDMHGFFARFPKRNVEFQKLAEILHSKGLKILRNVKTRWLSMMSPAIQIMTEYKSLLLKMMIDKEEFDVAKTCFDHLVDVQIVISLSCLVSMLRSLHSLMQFAQKIDIYICNYLAIIQLCTADITTYYINPQTRFKHDVF
jgi:hypothetical protein